MNRFWAVSKGRERVEIEREERTAVAIGPHRDGPAPQPGRRRAPWLGRVGEQVLDVAAGNGNATLAAARRSAAVTSTDYVPALLEHGRIRAEAERLEVTFKVADAEALPYPAKSFGGSHRRDEAGQVVARVDDHAGPQGAGAA